MPPSLVRRAAALLALAALPACAGRIAPNDSAAPARLPVPAIRRAEGDVDAALADSVRAAFRHAWGGYRRYAWEHDDLRPLSNGYRDWYRTPILMTPVDAFDTMKLMGLDAEAADAKQVILGRLSFDHDESVQLFEITIRELGGLLSAYQMDGDPRFLALADDLGRRLLPAFETPTGLPWRFVNLRTGAVRDSLTNPAEAGTLMLEFGTLAKLTGKAVYYEKAKRAAVAVFDRRSPLGLVGSTIDVRTGAWTDARSHVSGGIDSYYEYLLKSWLLFGDRDFERMWRETVGPVNRYLADERFGGQLWYGYADMNTGARGDTHYGALDAFLPAVLSLGGDVPRAARLMRGVDRMWTTWGIEPEEFDYATMTITAPGYELRPEAIESAYYLYTFTGDTAYRAMGRRMFEAAARGARTETGYAAISDVRTGAKADRQHSFWLAETLKYAFLLGAPRSTISLDRVVFNTEAHPLRRTW